VCVVKVPGRLLAGLNGATEALGTFGQPVDIVCHPATYSDFGRVTACVEAEVIRLVNEHGELVGQAPASA
jgi:hypothetical protein